MKVLKIIIRVVLLLALCAGVVFAFNKDFEKHYPNVSHFLVANNVEYHKSTTVLDLSCQKIEDADRLGDELKEFRRLRKLLVYGTEFGIEDAIKIKKKNPDLIIEAEVDFGGVICDTQTTEFIDFKRANLKGNEELDIVSAFGLFKNLKKTDMCGCGYSNEEMEVLTKTYPNTRFVWEIKLSKYWTLRTDAVAFSTLQGFDMPHRMTSEEAQPLKYCTDLIALDLGHNNVLDLSFLQYMPNLKVLILSDTMEGIINDEWRYIKDLSMVKHCPKLEYLEYFCNQVTDLSFLESLPNLVDLNISWSPVYDAKYLKNLPKIERLYMMGTSIPHEEYLYLQELYPNARVERYGKSSIDNEWRNHPRYHALRYMFLNNKVHPMFK